MNKLPNCPRCQNDELWLRQVGYIFRLRCYLCEWDSDIIEQVGNLNDAIASAIAFAADFIEKESEE